ncbi:MAG TPA: response regulator transcription factor [Burkholderiales bacterium]|nr:response regulator transcription factor [Burkholderiales bacterium]
MLVADDHAVIREGLQSVLEAAGIRVVAQAGDGREAISRCVETQPDVVLLDIAMPGLNGIEALGQLREKCPASRIVMLSMHASSEHVHRALAAGAVGYLLKEAAAAEIVAAVRSVHAGKQYLSPAVAAYERHKGDSPLARLSSRERQVLQLVVEGRSSAEIASQVHLSPKSVESYRSRLMKKLGVADVPALVKFALLHGLTPPG